MRRSPIAQPIAPSAAQPPASSSHALITVQTTSARPRNDLALVLLLVLVEPAWRPIGLGRVAPARAVNRGDVLLRARDVAVQFQGNDAFDQDAGGQLPILVIGAEHRDLDLVLFCVVDVVPTPEQTQTRPGRGPA